VLTGISILASETGLQAGRAFSAAAQSLGQRGVRPKVMLMYLLNERNQLG
jgi:hypothetical protein